MRLIPKSLAGEARGPCLAMRAIEFLVSEGLPGERTVPAGSFLEGDWMKSRFIPSLVLGLFVLLASRETGFGQGLTNSALRGRVTSEAQGLPGVQVELTSPALQGTRTTFTRGNGDYVFVGLPPGDYTVSFKLQGMQTVTKPAALTAAQETTLDASMVLSGVTAATTVTAKTETVSTSLQGSTTVTTEITDKLPVARTIVSAVAASAGVAQVTGLNNAFSISGGP